MSGPFREARDAAVGETVGGYRLDALLGEGGMGRVFRATRMGDGMTVALKVLKVALADNETYRQRFLHEARAAAEVSHHNLVPILDVGETDGLHFLVAAYVPGTTLSERIARGGPLSALELVRVVADVAAALEALHERGIVHRDVKSSNVLLGADGRAVLTDFGLAKGAAYTVLTRPGQVMGSLEYMAPELIRGEPATPSSDVYALGCAAYECAAGRTPFGDLTLFEVGVAHLDAEPADPAVARDEWPEALSSALLAALRKAPDERPSAAGYAERLAEAAAVEA